MSFEEFITKTKLSPVSPEASAAEDAWNAALEAVEAIIRAARPAESTVNNFAVLVLTEIEAIKSN